jgi:hypothetical protein
MCARFEFQKVKEKKNVIKKLYAKKKEELPYTMTIRMMKGGRIENFYSYYFNALQFAVAQ